MDDQSKTTLDTALALMTAMGSGDTVAMEKLMADDMVWENEGYKEVPLDLEGQEGSLRLTHSPRPRRQADIVGEWRGVRGRGACRVFGRTALALTKSEKNTGPFNFVVHIEVADGKIKR